MGRHIDILVFGPPGICDNCGCRCQGLHQVGIVCYHCGAGVFLPRAFWKFSRCPACCGLGGLCDICNRVGCLASPNENLDMNELRAFWRSLPDRYLRDGYTVGGMHPIHPLIMATAALADAP